MGDYQGAGAAYYDDYTIGLAGDVDFYVRQAASAGSPVLEVGCGTGRILIPIALAGVEVVGIDPSAAMLDQARRKVAALSPDVQGRVELVQADVRDFTLDRRFSLVAIPFRAFLRMLTPEDERRALLNVRQHLAVGGLLVLNVFDPRLDIIDAHAGRLGSAMKKRSEFVCRASGRRVVMWDSRRYDLGRQIVEQDLIFDELDEAGRVVSRSYSGYRLRYVYRQEMRYLLELCGFRVEALFGDFQRGPFHYGGEQIWVARKSDTAFPRE